MSEDKRKDFLAGEVEEVMVVDDDAAESCDYVVCLLEREDPGHFADNETGLCARCGESVIWRPHMPKKPQRICMQCVADMIIDDPDPELVTTKKNLDEQRAFQRKKLH